MANLKIKLVKSLIGRNKKHVATAISLGLKRPNDVTVQPNNVATQGKVKQISYLLSVTEE